MKVEKWNKRLVVKDGERVAYVPPGFLRHFHRHDLEEVAEAGCSLDAIMAFEDRFNPRLRRSP